MEHTVYLYMYCYILNAVYVENLFEFFKIASNTVMYITTIKDLLKIGRSRRANTF